MSVRPVEKVIVSCDQCHKDLLDDETESPALFATVHSAVEVVHDLAGECWGPWHMERGGSALCPDCRPKCPEPECDGYIDTSGQCDDRWHDTVVALGGESTNHSCDNCDGIGPDSCLMSDSDPAARLDGDQRKPRPPHLPAQDVETDRTGDGS